LIVSIINQQSIIWLNQNALTLAKEMRRLARNENQEPKLTVVKSASS